MPQTMTARPLGLGSGLRKLTTTSQYVWTHPENAHHRWRALGRLVGWQVWQRLVRKPLTVSLIGERSVRCYPHSTAASAVLYCRLPEWEDMKFVLAYLQGGDTFIDVGANVGVYTLLASVVDDVRVVAFEPSSRNQRRLEENLGLNGLERRVRIVGDAVGAKNGVAVFTTELDTVNHLVVPGEEPGGKAEWVRLVTLDSALGDHERATTALVKIDVEGGEVDVLYGAAALIAASSPTFIVERNTPDTLQDFFAEHRYVTCRYDPRSHALRPCPIGEAPGNNVIAVRDVDAARDRLARHPFANHVSRESNEDGG